MTAYQLPVKPETGGRKTEGFMTPTADQSGQMMSVPPKRVLPIIFLPGIMGSNLRLSAERQRAIGKSNNIAWRPDKTSEALGLVGAEPAVRQRQLDPSQTEVDVYDPVNNPTGSRNETADERHANAKANVDYKIKVAPGIQTPLLMDDPATYGDGRRTKEQKARERGWGEVFFGSYHDLLEMCELRLNTAFYGGKLDDWWKQVVGVEPARWQAVPSQATGKTLQPLTEDELKAAVHRCWFPVHAMGYNWLQSNRDSGIAIAGRITALIAKYNEQGFDCEKVIVVTHSMGGLAARALIHPGMGNLQDKVLGIVHGVMPATGAGAAYKRMRCGFEGGLFNIPAKVLGNHGDEVTAVLGNAPGGLELLPSQAYGNEWLQVEREGRTLKSLPRKGDPYEEIYKLRGKWYGLLREEWLSPAPDVAADFRQTCRYLDAAKKFHNDILSTYHPNSYAHYGADQGHAAWHRVVWDLGVDPIAVRTAGDVDQYRIISDDRQGSLLVVNSEWPETRGATTPGPTVLFFTRQPGRNAQRRTHQHWLSLERVPRHAPVHLHRPCQQVQPPERFARTADDGNRSGSIQSRSP